MALAAEAEAFFVQFQVSGIFSRCFMMSRCFQHEPFLCRVSEPFPRADPAPGEQKTCLQQSGSQRALKVVSFNPIC